MYKDSHIIKRTGSYFEYYFKMLELYYDIYSLYYGMAVSGARVCLRFFSIALGKAKASNRNKYEAIHAMLLWWLLQTDCVSSSAHGSWTAGFLPFRQHE